MARPRNRIFFLLQRDLTRFKKIWEKAHKFSSSWNLQASSYHQRGSRTETTTHIDTRIQTDIFCWCPLILVEGPRRFALQKAPFWMYVIISIHFPDGSFMQITMVAFCKNHSPLFFYPIPSFPTILSYVPRQIEYVPILCIRRNLKNKSDAKH